MLLFQNYGSLLFLKMALKHYDAYGSGEFFVNLYTNNYTPTVTSMSADFTLATFTGYSATSLDHTLWDDPSIVSDQAHSSYNGGTPLSWTNTGSDETVYGYMVNQPAVSTQPIWSEKFATSFDIVNLATFFLIMNMNGATCSVGSPPSPPPPPLLIAKRGAARGG